MIETYIGHIDKDSKYQMLTKCCLDGMIKYKDLRITSTCITNELNCLGL